MAISGQLCKLLRTIQPILPRGGSLLEIGEANWYGDAPPLLNGSVAGDSFAVAKAFYESLFAPSRIVSIDMHGTKAALRHDLNCPLPHDKGCSYDDIENIHGIPCTCRNFSVVINHGTAEHVFNIAQVFRTMHERCEVDGVMIHDAPFTSWIDHGFYCLQPTLFYDLARANSYEVANVSLYEIKSGWTQRVEGRDHIAHIDVPDNACLFVAYRKRYDTDFCIPGQGVYTDTLSAAGMKAWRENR